MHTPSKVRLLPPSVAERIAAGEVIERPASVVKELVENSIDAGATEITVLLEDGGKSLIEILDNGHGMPPEDLSLCIQRHATSKLTQLSDLEAIRTLGFRGEALPSIAAVSELSLLSRARGAETAYELALGDALSNETGSSAAPVARTFGHFLSSPHGTRIQARGLFSQVPARLKFLRSQGAEVSQVREWIERLALAHPEIGFRLVSEGRPILTLRPATADCDGEASRVRAILSDGEDYPIVTATNDLGFRDRTEGSLHIRVHWLQGMSLPQARRVVQVVNGRALRDRVLQQAVLAPFRQALLPGQFPAVALYVEIDPARIDVNVHPTKTEVRFLESGKIFKAVESVVSSMIAQHGAPAFAAAAATPHAQQPSWAPPAFQRSLWTAGDSAGDRSQPQASWQDPPMASPLAHAHTPESTDAPSPTRGSPFLPQQYAGAVFNTYLLYDLGNELALIDQHAAHERVSFERFRRAALSGDRRAPQQLLLPEAVKFAPESRAVLEARLPWLERLGFETEIFGEDTLLFRAVPSDWSATNLRLRLKGLVERALAAEAPEGASALPALQALQDERLFESLASEACHSSVRAGDRLEREEALRLVDDLFRCEHPWNCPHGRPTVARIPKARFEEWFQRRV